MMTGPPAAIDAPLPFSLPFACRGSVMVVDDSPPNLRLIEELLGRHGYEVISFPTGRTALRAAVETPPDLILLDINMPEMNGFEVCDALKSCPELSEIPVIFLSALSTRKDRLRGFQSGGVDYVSKPFQGEEVLARVDAHVRLRRFQLGIETDNRRLQEQVQIQLRKTVDAQMATIFAIAKLAEVRDDETGRHLERIQEFCGLLANRLSEHPKYKPVIGPTWVTNIIHASPLHDIGKVAIPDRVLLKPGSLTSAEAAIMRTHAALGAQTLRAVLDRYPENEFIEMGIDVARSHHERWDGSGYPEGLAGESIPLCARVLAVADCYDAIRSKRCYKPAVPHDETCAIILSGAGKHFDPTLARVFAELANSYRETWDRMDCEATSKSK